MISNIRLEIIFNQSFMNQHPIRCYVNCPLFSKVGIAILAFQFRGTELVCVEWLDIKKMKMVIIYRSLPQVTSMKHFASLASPKGRRPSEFRSKAM
ncbi:hypothetical protein JS87_23855 [Vibrio vulnificus]|nr:hypothetical protein JS87_23855 [Vibrio vulnificus]